MNKAPQDPPVPDSKKLSLKCNHIIKTRFLSFMKKNMLGQGVVGGFLLGQVKKKKKHPHVSIIFWPLDMAQVPHLIA